MKNIPHVLKDNKGNATPRNIIFVDTETNYHDDDEKETTHNLKLGVACYYRRREPETHDQETWLDFTTSDEFWAWLFSLIQKKSRYYLVAHNVGFDFKVLQGFNAMEKENWIMKKLIINGTTNIWEFRKDTSTIVVLDNMNYFKVSLKSLGESLAIAKLPMPSAAAPTSEWITYCRQDVNIMLQAWKMWLEFLREHDLGNFAKTLASQAMNAYRHRFMPTKIYIHHYADITRLERESYHGGRTECFFIGRAPAGRYSYFDVNSMYPSVMQEYDYPTKAIARYSKLSPRQLKTILASRAVTADCLVNTEEPVFATKHNNRLVFPIGKFRTTLTTREVEYAIDKGYLLETYEVIVYEKANLFRDYVTFFYKTRLDFKRKGQTAYSYMCKLLLNSLYGKFGQRNEQYSDVGTDKSLANGSFSEIDAKTGLRRKYRVINGIVSEASGYKEGFNSFVAIAAHITADARMKLWSYMKRAGEGNVLYCDTDSLFVTDAGRKNLLPFCHEGELGALGLVKESDKLHIRGLKDYTFGTEETIKGVRKDAKRIDESTFEQTQFEGILGALKNGRLNTMVTRKVRKHLSRNYTKGYASMSGWVSPINLDTR